MKQCHSHSLKGLFLPIILMGLTSGAFAIDYTVTITTLPLDGPIPPYQQTPLHCSLSPDPQEPVIYQWKSTVFHHYIHQESETSPVGFYRPLYSHPRLARAFCRVKSLMDDRTLAVGSTELETQGYIESTGQTDLQLSPPAPLKLETKISSEYERKGKSPLTDVRISTTWTHNGLVVNNRNDDDDGRGRINRTKLSLCVNTTQDQDVGTYELQITHFSIVSEIVNEEPTAAVLEDSTIISNVYCSGIILQAMGLYAMLDPVLFEVQQKSLSDDVVEQRRAEVFEKHYFSENEPLRVRVDIPLLTIGRLDYVNISESEELLYVLNHNGREVFDTSDRQVLGHLNPSDTQYSSEYEITRLSPAQVSLFLPLPQKEDAGIFEFQFFIHISMIQQELNMSSCDRYMNFLTNSVRLEYVMIGTATLDMQLDDSPPITVTTDKEYFTTDNDDEGSTLTCSIYQRRLVDLSELNWSKNGHTIVTTNSPVLLLETNDVLELTEESVNVYGAYICTVIEESGQVGTRAIHIAERAPFSVHLRPEQGSDCVAMSMDDNFKTNLLAEIETILSLACSCNVTTEHFISADMSCDNDMLTLTMDFAYSNSNGTVTATNVLRSAATWLMGVRTFDGGSLTIDTSCALRDASGACIEGASQLQGSTVTTVLVVVLVLVFIAGMVPTLILMGLIIRRCKQKHDNCDIQSSEESHENTPNTRRHEMTSRSLPAVNMIYFARDGRGDAIVGSQPHPVRKVGRRTQSQGGRSNNMIATNRANGNTQPVGDTRISNILPRQTHQGVSNSINEEVNHQRENERIETSTHHVSRNLPSNIRRPPRSSVNCIPNPAYTTRVDQDGLQQRQGVRSNSYLSIRSSADGNNRDNVTSPVSIGTSGEHTYDYPRFESHEEEIRERCLNQSQNSDGYVI